MLNNKTFLKVYLALILAVSWGVQATENTANFFPSLRISTSLSKPSDRVNAPTFTITPEVQPLRLRWESEPEQLAALPHRPDIPLLNPDISPLHKIYDVAKPPAASSFSYWFTVAQYLLWVTAALFLLYTLRRYWLSRNQSSRYTSVKTKFVIAFLSAILWTVLSVYLARYWFYELSGFIGVALAALVILGIAIIPGFMNTFLVTSLLMDRRPVRVGLAEYPPLTILISAYNEEAIISKTLKSIALQHYPAPLEVMVIDDGSSDATAAIVADEATRYSWLKLIRMPKNGGKAIALNQGLAQASNPLLVTLDADSYLYADALKSIVERYFGDPSNTKVVAGTVLVQNSRESWITRAQEWDYFHGIAAIKRAQSLFQGTLVAQGAFSLYDRQTLIEVGGWPNCVGEDIVLTWAILNRGYRVGHCEDACVFTNVPARLKQFSRQRQRWSRGMIEAFKQHPSILFAPRLSTFFIYWNILFPFLDLVFTVFFIPGLIMALFGYYWIAGPMTLALLPIAMAMNYVMFFFGKKTFTSLNLQVRTNIIGFLIYTIGYSLIMQPVCLGGYLSELFNRKKNWGTK
ncbi:MAG: glycosyltransferase [Gallionellaceae bacterium]|nr:glycosyltransferase [Gallionellaceae bacterium]